MSIIRKSYVELLFARILLSVEFYEKKQVFFRTQSTENKLTNVNSTTR